MDSLAFRRYGVNGEIFSKKKKGGNRVILLLRIEFQILQAHLLAQWFR
jgi:hypothetical protein